MMRLIYGFCLFLNISLSWASHEIVHIAVSSSIGNPLTSLCQKFNQSTKYGCKITTAPAGHLYAHIMHGMAYDLFLSADETYTEGLINAKKADAQSRIAIAEGRIVLWSADPKITPEALYQILTEKENIVIAIANPGASSYGAAAREMLQEYGLWTNIQSRLIYGKNIKHTYELIMTQRIPLGFISLAQLSPEVRARKQYWEPQTYRYKPVKHEVITLKAAKNQKALVAFRDFLRNDQSCQILSEAGYGCSNSLHT
ncbi:MAG: molybdate ABC transporter substrate-binding protein [Gammaproteobacteria bacterium]|nr:molybdate ABC transporter substrate-binding protein [Gammaproteobacteria bacterium]